ATRGEGRAEDKLGGLQRGAGRVQAELIADGFPRGRRFGRERRWRQKFNPAPGNDFQPAMGDFDGEEAGGIAEMVRMGAAGGNSGKRFKAVLEASLSRRFARSEMRDMMRKGDIVFI